VKPSVTQLLAALSVGLVLSACASAEGDPSGTASLSVFSEGSLVTGRVLENVTACEVDAVCYLRLQFADTTITAIYGTGERPAPPCPISVAVSNAAFAVERGDVLAVAITACPGEGMFLERIASEP